MDDIIILKRATAAPTLDSTGFSFPRVMSEDSQYRRQNLGDGSLNPMVIRVSHQPISAKRTVQRSLFALDKTYARLDATNNVVGSDSLGLSLQFNRTSGVTEAEFILQFERLVGALMETRSAVTYALAKSLFNTET
jgi:microsomal dipeptidase-like Zn-dependent dipeptidase